MSSLEQDLQPVTTPIHTYAHPEHKNVVDVVGMIHIAQAPYYDTIQDIVDAKDSDGAVVHYELVIKNTPEEIEDASPMTAVKLSQLTRTLNGVYGILDGLDMGLVKQIDTLTYHDHWHNKDATELDIATRLGSFTLLRHLALIKLVTTSFGLLNSVELQEQKRKILLGALQKSGQDEEDPKKAFIKRVLLGSIDATILDYRNNIALSAYDQQLRRNPGADVVLIWGAAHLKGLGKGLEKRGFKKVHEEKIVAIDASITGKN